MAVENNPLNDLRTRQFQLFGEGHQNRCIFSVFNGQLNMSVAQQGDFKNADRKLIRPEIVTVLKRAIRKMKDLGPDEQFPIVVSWYDRENREYKRDYVINLVKDDSRRFFLDVDTGNGAKRFAFPRLNHVQVSSEPMSEAQQSSVRMDEFLDYLEVRVPMEAALSNLDRGQGNRSRGGGQSSGGSSGGSGGGSSSSKSSGSSESSESSSSGESSGTPEGYSDDIPF